MLFMPFWVFRRWRKPLRVQARDGHLIWTFSLINSVKIKQSYNGGLIRSFGLSRIWNWLQTVVDLIRQFKIDLYRLAGSPWSHRHCSWRLQYFPATRPLDCVMRGETLKNPLGQPRGVKNHLVGASSTMFDRPTVKWCWTIIFGAHILVSDKVPYSLDQFGQWQLFGLNDRMASAFALSVSKPMENVHARLGTPPWSVYECVKLIMIVQYVE
jgi:hypothetical protein